MKEAHATSIVSRHSYDRRTRLWTAEERNTGTRAHGTTRLQAEARLRRKIAQLREVADAE